MLKKQSLILITGGHFTPAQAVIAELKKRGHTNFIWVGHKYNQAGNKEVSAEYKIVNGMEIPFINLTTGKLFRTWNQQTIIPGLLNFLYLFSGFFKALYIILKYRPALILSFGGYLAVPIVIWGNLLGAKIVTHEQTIVAGLANRIIGKFAHKVCISWESSIKFFNKNKIEFTGNPIRREIFASKDDSLTKDLDRNKPLLYITGGNQGAHEINRRIFDYLPQLLQECNIIHQTGNSTTTNDFRKALDIQKELPADLMFRYVPVEYVGSDHIGDIFSKAGLIFSRSGANTISEIMALGKLSILMPIPNTSHDEQVRNAVFVEQIGLSYLLIQKDTLTSQTVYQTILMGLNQIRSGKGFNGRDIEECRQIAKEKIILDAPKRVADVIENI